MKIEDIAEAWRKDAPIDSVELDTESLNIPVLHAKYLSILYKERLKLKSLLLKKKQLAKTLSEYFRGDLNNPEDLTAIGRQPQLKTILKADINDYVDSDSEMIEMNLKISMQQEIVDVLEEIMKGINGRNWIIKNALDWRRLTNFGDL